MGRGPKVERTASLFRLDPRVVEAMKDSAEQDMRSLNAQVEVFLREGLARRGFKLRPAGNDAPPDKDEEESRHGEDDG